MPQPSNANKYFSVSENYLSSYQINAYAEVVQMYGYNVKYIPVEFLEDDINWVFGELVKLKYTMAFDIRMYIKGYDELHKAMINYNKYGMLILPDTLEISVGVGDYNTIVLQGTTILPPKVGDLIYFEIHNESIIFEVTSISFKFNSFYLFEVKLYGHTALNSIQTGIDKIDNISNILSNNPETLSVENDKIEIANDEFQDKSQQSSVWGDL